MIDYLEMSNEQLRIEEVRRRALAKEQNRIADWIFAIRIARDSKMMLREAEIAKARAMRDEPCRGCGVEYSKHKGLDHMYDTPKVLL